MTQSGMGEGKLDLPFRLMLLQLGNVTITYMHVIKKYLSVNLHTVLTRHYAPFNYKPPLTICINLLWRYIYLQFTPPLAIHGKSNKNGKTLQLRRMRGRLELTVPTYTESSYLLASDTTTNRLATRWLARS